MNFGTYFQVYRRNSWGLVALSSGRFIVGEYDPSADRCQLAAVGYADTCQASEPDKTFVVIRHSEQSVYETRN